MQEQIKKMVALAPNTSGAGRIELGRRIVAYGEPATPILVDALSDPDANMRGTAAWLLGFMKDPRTANPLARAASDKDKLVRYEAASALLQIGDPRGLQGVISGLSDQDPRIRQKCIGLLEAHTGETMGYRADDRPEERAAAVARWRAWARSRRECP
jgi:HEAT repeat protein